MTHDLLSDPELLEQLRKKFQEFLPDLWDQMEQALDSEDPEKIDAMIQRLFDPEVVARLAECVHQANAPEVALTPIPPKLDEASLEQVVTKDRRGNPRLNPLYEAAVAERLQFDGDAPELRHGPIPSHATPAIGVETTVSNPVALGSMLETAQEVVQTSVDEARAETKALLSSSSLDLSVVDPPVVESSLYKVEPGKVPAPLSVETPTGRELAALEPEKKKALVWKVVSTTQGRRSAVGALEEILHTRFAEAGLHVECVTFLEPVNYRASWTFPLQKGHATLQERFSHIETAGAILFQKLFQQLKEANADFEGEATLCVSTVDGISEGVAGWEASMCLEVL